MTTITPGKAFPTGFFTDVEMDTPESIAAGTDFTVTVRFAGDPANPFWTFIRDLGTVSHKVELVADTIGPGTDVSLNGPAGAVGLLVASQDTYDVAINVSSGGTLAAGLYELGAVITFSHGGSVLSGVSAFLGDAVMQVR